MREIAIALKGYCKWPKKRTKRKKSSKTYILENDKGQKAFKSYHVKARKHRAKESKRGISDEYICVCTSVTGVGKVIALAINRATPSKAKIPFVLDFFCQC